MKLRLNNPSILQGGLVVSQGLVSPLKAKLAREASRAKIEAPII